MIELKKVETNLEIEVISKIAYEIFPIDYLGYVQKENLENFLNHYQSIKAIQNQLAIGFLYYLILEKKEIVGYAGLTVEGNVAVLSKFYLCLANRNQGLGQKVLFILEKLAQERDCELMELLVLCGNHRAIKFYQMNGFVIDSSFVETFDDVNTEKHYKMTKSLK